MKNVHLLILSILLANVQTVSYGQVDTNGQCDGSAVTPCLIDQGIVDSAGCAAVGDPFIWGGDCTIAINRYISRTANMDGLVEFNVPSTCWGHPNPPAPNIPVNCAPPYDSCWGYYCPETYCKSIKMLVETNTQFVARAATAWFHESGFQEGGAYFEASKQLICDINAAYDCAGLRRPIIQAGIFEGVGDVNNITIPSEVISAFIDEMTQEERDYYLDANGKPKENLEFNRTRMFTGNEYDIRNMETKLWFFYQAKSFIDMGYTALHMGIYWFYASHDTGYVNLYNLLKKMREYAGSVGSFVIMNGENPMPPTDNGESAKLGGTDSLLFDFDGRAMRPREISDPQVTGDGGIPYVGCDTPVDPDQFNGTPCESIKMMAIIDTCTINSFGGSVGGISPSGCYYDQVPYFIYTDFGSGLVNTGFGCPGIEILWDSVGVPSNGNSSLTWGYDDNRWFAEVMTPECREYWWQNFYCAQRNMHGGNGFFQIPGILILKHIENYCDTVMPLADGRFVLADDTTFINAIQETLQPKVPQLNFEIICNPVRVLKTCNGVTAPKFTHFCAGQNTFKVTVGNKDCSSTYSIHVKKTGGSWFPYVIGTEMEFSVDQPGQYIIYIRQDNMGLDPSTYGTYTLSDTFYLTPLCCTGPYYGGGCPEILPLTDKGNNLSSPTFSRKEHNANDLFEFDVTGFTIYPNPSTNQVTVEIPAGLQNNTELVISDNMGQVVQRFQVNPELLIHQIDVSRFIPGVYLFTLLNNQISETQRVIVLR